MQNSSLGMTKEQYLDMCEQLGSTPLEEEIPVEVEDMELEVQEALSIYRILRDEWEYVGGNYLGKNLNNLFELFAAHDIPSVDYKVYYELIHMIDSLRIEEMRKQNKEKPAN